MANEAPELPPRKSRVSTLEPFDLQVFYGGVSSRPGSKVPDPTAFSHEACWDPCRCAQPAGSPRSAPARGRRRPGPNTCLPCGAVEPGPLAGRQRAAGGSDRPAPPGNLLPHREGSRPSAHLTHAGTLGAHEMTFAGAPPAVSAWVRCAPLRGTTLRDLRVRRAARGSGAPRRLGRPGLRPPSLPGATYGFILRARAPHGRFCASFQCPLQGSPWERFPPRTLSPHMAGVCPVAPSAHAGTLGAQVMPYPGAPPAVPAWAGQALLRETTLRDLGCGRAARGSGAP